MTVENETELERLKVVGAAVARTLRTMAAALEPGMTTNEFDDIGRQSRDAHGARSAPEITYGFPGGTCIIIHPAIAHGVPGERAIAAGDLINIDVSAEMDGTFADTGASFIVPPASPAKKAVCRATRKALNRAVAAVRAGLPINVIGKTVERIARKGGFSVIENLAGHGVGNALHEAPSNILSYYDASDRRILREGMVIAVEPFLSTGAANAEQGDDPWTLVTPPHFLTAQRAYPSEPGLTTCWVCGCHRRNVRLMFRHAQPLEVRPPDVPRRLRGALSR